MERVTQTEVDMHNLFHGTRQWIYTRAVKGRFQQLHRASGVLLIGVLYVLPWIWVGGHPLVLADLPARRFYLAGHVFTASDGFLMVLMALLAAFGMFLASALLGRLWCGYLCPQTVFLEEWVRRVEAFFEGDGAARLRRDAGAWTPERIARKTGKVIALALLATTLGLSVISYFSGAYVLWTGGGSSTAYIMVAIIAGSALADWLWFREQLCIYLCPYARFQSALTDDYSLTVAYDVSVPVMQGKAAIEAKACIDCKKCVTVCPQGIDIRDGFQLECINCARCVDACTDVMRKLDRPSLVNYTTVALLEGREQKTIRPRVVIYSALVTGLLLVLLGSMAFHNPIEVSVRRAPGTLYQLDDDGMVRNTYLVRIVNNAQGEARDFEFDVEGVEGMVVDIPAIHLEAEETRTIPLILRAPVGSVGPTEKITVHVRGGEQTVEIDTTFKAPRRRG